ncbi:MAG: hypothetical protein EON59_03930 [Alphaproteobacteria bacterium]|nr:MAG: hypothetical protein EON59_03930 [Alphaproteobacteria bacterium]
MLADLSPDRPMTAGIAALQALATDTDGVPLAAAELPLTDYECALAALRQEQIGDTVSTAPACPHCDERMELSFSIDALLHDVVQAVAPVPRGSPASQDFRLPTAGDAAACENDPEGPARMLAACIPRGLSAPRQRKAEAALEQGSPLLSRPIEAPCAACGESITAHFHLPGFVMTELTWRTRSVFDEVHLLARGYGWSESQILDLPRNRRRRYATLLREAA